MKVQPKPWTLALFAVVATDLAVSAPAANAAVITYDYDLSGRATLATNSTQCKGVTYTYDAANNRATTTIEQAPKAKPATASTPKNVAVPVDLTSKISDADGDSLTITSATSSQGSTSISGNVVTFTPNTNFTGTATINYSIKDGRKCPGTTTNATDSSTITVTVT